MPSNDYYLLLGLEKNASSEEIKRIYKKLAKRLHPDSLGADPSPEEKRSAEEHFKRMQEAYEAILSDALKRENSRSNIERETKERENQERKNRERESRERESRERESREREEQERLQREKKERMKYEDKSSGRKWLFSVFFIFVVLALGWYGTQDSNTPILSVSSYSKPSVSKEQTGKITLQGLTFMTQAQPALETAKAQGKPIFVYARSQVCGWCKKFEAETFTNETVIKTLNEHFILLSIDIYEQRNESINLRVRGTPTEIFLNEKGIEITRIPGYTETQPFLDTINEIIK